MPEPLALATVTRRSKDLKVKTSHEQWRQDMDDRGIYLMRVKQKPDKDGTGERVGCPASGTNPLIACPSKPNSTQQRKTRQADGKVIDARLTINPAGLPTGDAQPTVCTQDTLTLHRDDQDENVDKYRQELRYGTTQHTTTYVRLRQAQEGLHGFARNSHESPRRPRRPTGTRQSRPVPLRWAPPRRRIHRED